MTSQTRLNAFYSSRARLFAASPHEHQGGGRYPADALKRISDLEIASVVRRLKLNPHTTRVLDIGAGGGRWSLALAPRVHAVIALEPSALYELLATRTAHLSQITVRRETFEDFQPAHAYDVAIVYGTLMHQPDDALARAFLQKAADSLAPGGTLVLGETMCATRQHWADWQRVPLTQSLDHARYWEIHRTCAEYAAYGREAGLRLRAVLESHGPLGGQTALWSIMRRAPWPLVRAYNRLTRTAWGRIKHWRHQRRMRLMIWARD